MAARDQKFLCQYGALPFSVSEDGGTRILLVTTRGRQGWIIPKGWPIRRLTPAATAAREAYEEAGLLGTVISDSPCGSFRHEKRGSPHRGAVYEVSVFLFAVERQLRKWPERSERLTRWFSPEEAADAVFSPGLAELLRISARDLIEDQTIYGGESVGAVEARPLDIVRRMRRRA
jgi:8-oxo-dGTP pyrophosphatase MutT (NUDIX family)